MIDDIKNRCLTAWLHLTLVRERWCECTAAASLLSFTPTRFFLTGVRRDVNQMRPSPRPARDPSSETYPCFRNKAARTSNSEIFPACVSSVRADGRVWFALYIGADCAYSTEPIAGMFLDRPTCENDRISFNQINYFFALYERHRLSR